MDVLNTQLNSSLDNEQPLDKIKKIFSGPKIIFAILGIVLIVELIFALRVLTAPTPPPPQPRKIEITKTGGKIALFSAKKSYTVKETIPVSVVIGTGGHTIDGVDLIVRFDPKMLEATQGGLIKGKILSEYPLVSLDANKGLISISGISTLKTGFIGTGQFASIVFKPKSTGKTSVSIDFKKDSTTDSNLVEAATSKDILEVVDNLELNIN